MDEYVEIYLQTNSSHTVGGVMNPKVKNIQILDSLLQSFLNHKKTLAEERLSNLRAELRRNKEALNDIGCTKKRRLVEGQMENVQHEIFLATMTLKCHKTKYFPHHIS